MKKNEHPDNETDALLKLDNQICFAAYATAHAFAQAYKPLLSELNLTYPQYLVMMVLWEHGTLSVNAIGKQLGLDSGTLSPLLKRLEAASYIVRRRSNEDERRVEVTLSGKGKDAREQAKGVALSISQKTGCNSADASALIAQLTALRNQLLKT